MAQLVTFNYAEWISQYPMFNVAPTVTTEPVAQNLFDIAGAFYLRNDGTGPVCDPVKLKLLLYMLVAHLAAMSVGYGGRKPSGMIGRISSASEGSVSISSEFNGTQNSIWYSQTQWGAAYWQATAGFRQARYVRGPTRFGTGRSAGYMPGAYRRF